MRKTFSKLILIGCLCTSLVPLTALASIYTPIMQMGSTFSMDDTTFVWESGYLPNPLGYLPTLPQTVQSIVQGLSDHYLSLRVIFKNYDSSFDSPSIKAISTAVQEEYSPKMKEALQQVTLEALQYPTVESKLMYIHYFILKNCRYDYDLLTSSTLHPGRSAYGALIEGKTICSGYATLFSLLCKELDIPCVNVVGTQDGGNHMWNSVLIKDTWYMVDTTFDDIHVNLPTLTPSYSLAQYKNQFSYFLKSPEFMNREGYRWDEEVLNLVYTLKYPK